MDNHYKSPIRLYWSDVETSFAEGVDGAIVARAEQMLDIQIDKDELMKALKYDRDQYNKGYHDGRMWAFEYAAGKVEVVRCKDCVHRPEISKFSDPAKHCYNGIDIEFPDDVCPCQNEDDPWYSWRPVDEWYCPKGEKAR